MMEYLEAKATATPTTDLGEFEALVATWDQDRGGDVIRRGAFAETIREWQSVGRLVPLHDNHDPAVIVGEVDPDSMVETRDGLKVSGRVDLDTERGREIWRSLRANRIGFSFGYLATKEDQRDDGGRELLELDVYEISTTPSPMNNRTRILSTKSATATESLSDAELRQRSLALAREAIAGAVSKRPMSKEDEALVERSHAEYKAARAAEVEAEEEEEEARRRRLVNNFPLRKSVLMFVDGAYRAFDPDDVELATPQQIEEREQQRLEKEAQGREIAESRARAAEQEPPTVSVCGMEVARVTVNGVPVFGEEL